MPRISNFYEITTYMYAEERNPPHFHVWYEGYRVTIGIENAEVKVIYQEEF